MHERILQLLMAFAQAVGKRTAGIVLWLLQPILVLFLRWVPSFQATQSVLAWCMLSHLLRHVDCAVS